MQLTKVRKRKKPLRAREKVRSNRDKVKVKIFIKDYLAFASVEGSKRSNFGGHANVQSQMAKNPRAPVRGMRTY